MTSSRWLIQKAGYLENDDRELIAQAQSGSHAAFEEIYRTHVGRVYAICLRILADRLWAEEAAQKIFVRAWIKLNSFRAESSFATWLYRLSVNLVLGELNASGRRNLQMVQTAAIPDGSSGGETAPNLRLDLEKAIATLPRQARAVFVLHDVEGWKHGEIAGAMGIAIGTCKAQLARARRLLREVLET
jgi:RNA polymerase sigma-70 factor (ECF subfamily)